MRAWVLAIAACGSSHSSPKDSSSADAARDAAIDSPPGSGCIASPFTGQATTINAGIGSTFALPRSLAFAVSDAGDGTLHLEQPLTAAATPIAAFTMTSTQAWDHPALSPDGNELFAREYNSNTIWSSTKTGGVWAAPVVQTGSWFSDSLASTPAAIGSAGDVRMMIWDDVQMTEYVRTAGTWTAVGSSLSNMELLGQNANIASPALTPDGLSLLFMAGTPGPTTDHIWYAHRSDLNAAFTLPATSLLGPTQLIYAPYLTEDCASLYVTDNGKLVKYGP